MDYDISLTQIDILINFKI